MKLVQSSVSSQSKMIAVSYCFGFSIDVSQIFSYVNLLNKFFRSLSPARSLLYWSSLNPSFLSSSVGVCWKSWPSVSDSITAFPLRAETRFPSSSFSSIFYSSSTPWFTASTWVMSNSSCGSFSMTSESCAVSFGLKDLILSKNRLSSNRRGNLSVARLGSYCLTSSSERSAPGTS